MTSTEGRTPGPWKQDGRYIARADPDVIALIATTNIGGADSATQEANAAFIVLACNSHDRLVKALEQAALELREAANVFRPTFPGMATLMDMASENARSALTTTSAAGE